jgi:hypothetical protein
LPARRLLYRLAREIGGMTVAELERRLTYREYLEWVAIFQIEFEEQEEIRNKSKNGGMLFDENTVEPSIPLDPDHPDYQVALAFHSWGARG